MTGMTIGCVVAQVASRRPITAQTQFRLQANRCVTCGGQSASGTAVTPTTIVFPCHYQSTNAPLSPVTIIPPTLHSPLSL